MSSAPFALIIALFFAIRCVFSFRKSFLLFVALAPFFPAYIAVSVTQGGAGISAFQMTMLAMTAYLFASILAQPAFWKPAFLAISRAKPIYMSLIALSLARFFSTLVQQDASRLIYWFYDTTMIFTLIVISVKLFQYDRNLKFLAKVLLFAAIINLSLIPVELYNNQPLPSGILKLDVSTLGADVFQAKVRGGGYRTQLLFGNPLSMAEYFIYVSIFLLFFARYALRESGLIIKLVGYASFFATVFTGSRFPYLVLLFLVIWLVYLKSSLLVSAKSQQMIFRLILISVIVAVFNLVSVLADTEYLTFLYGDDASSRASIISRGTQWAVIPTEISSNGYMGLLGEGYRSDFLEKHNIKLDNYFFRLLIEGGWIAAISFFSSAYFAIISSLNLWRTASKNDSLVLSTSLGGLFLVVFFAIFIVTKFFLSLDVNNYFYYLFLGMLIALQSRGKLYAHPPRP